MTGIDEHHYSHLDELTNIDIGASPKKETFTICAPKYWPALCQRRSRTPHLTNYPSPYRHIHKRAILRLSHRQPRMGPVAAEHLLLAAGCHVEERAAVAAGVFLMRVRAGLPVWMRR